jgi:outer membrane protein assembly factor BamD (BamD/ComL family)
VTRYERRFPAGVFAEEIYVIRIDALAMGGERTRARALAERFLTAHPTSAYVARVHSIAERCRD